jgi:hypothetical protein
VGESQAEEAVRVCAEEHGDQRVVEDDNRSHERTQGASHRAPEDEVNHDVFLDGDEGRENPMLSDVEEDQDEWYYTWGDGTPCTREEFDTRTADSEMLTNGKTYFINEEGMMVRKNV